MKHEILKVDAPPLARRDSLPAIIEAAGNAARFAYEQDFLSEADNEHTKLAYRRAAERFLAWCHERGKPLHKVLPADVREYIDALTSARRDHEGNPRVGSKSMKKLHLTAIRKLFDKLVVRHAVVLNPAASVKGPKHRVSEGLTPPTSPKAVESMLAGMDTSNLVRLRDACIVGVLAWTAARAGAVAGLRRGDYFSDGTQYYLRFAEKGGRVPTIPVRHDLFELLERYLDRAGLRDAHPDAPLFCTARGKTKRLTTTPLSGKDIACMARRRFRDAGLPSKLTAHSFRATTATALIEQGSAAPNLGEDDGSFHDPSDDGIL